MVTLSEANESIRRAEALDDKDSIKITKILLDLFGKNFSLFSTRELIESSIDISENKLNKSLKDLEEKIIIFRKFKNAFSLFSGSDINLDELSEHNKTKIRNDYDIILSQLPPLQPIVAKRHFFRTGTQRIFRDFV